MLWNILIPNLTNYIDNISLVIVFIENIKILETAAK